MKTYRRKGSAIMTNSVHSVPDGSIPILVSSDENYARHMCVMLVSMLENASRPEHCHICVIDGGIKPETRKTIKEEVEKRKGIISFLDIDGSVYRDYPMSQNLTVAAYYRISIPELLSDSVKKVIYLDCDLIVKEDILNLWHFPLNGKHLAAVQDLSNSSHLTSGVPRHKYFNSGVLLIDLEKWRRDGIAEKVHEYLNAHPEKIQFPDQCALNGVLFESWERLPLRWNHQSGVYRSSRKRFRHFTAEEIKEARWNPGIIHYIGTSKPWKYPCFHPLADEYHYYLNRTAWAGAKIEGRSPGAFLSWSLKPKLLKKYLRKLKWQRRYAKLHRQSS